jgi:hypothetical protein
VSDTSSVITREKAIDVPHQLGKIRDVLLEILLCGLDPSAVQCRIGEEALSKASDTSGARRAMRIRF